MHSFQREGPHGRSPRPRDAQAGAGRLGWARSCIPGKSSLAKFKIRKSLANAIVLSDWLPESWKSRIIIKSCPASSITDQENRCYGCSCFHEGYTLLLPLVTVPVAQPCHSKLDLAGMTSECAQEAQGCSPRQLGGGSLRALTSGVV